MKGCRTADNLFIIKGLIQRQLLMGKSLVLCFIDFSKAFDLVNRDILFFNISILSRYLSNRSCVWGLGVIGQDAPR